MDSCSKGCKWFIEFESYAWGQHEVSEIQTDRAEAKHQRQALESTGDDFEKFVALLDRIQYMKTNRMNFSDAKVTETKSSWLPSFQLEDFCGFEAKDTMSAQRDKYCSPPRKDNPPSSYEEKEKQSFQPSIQFNIGSSWDDKLLKSFHLNLEASLHHRIYIGF